MEGVYDHLASKSDLAELRAEQKADITELRAELKADIAELRAEQKADIAELRIDLAQRETRLIKWMVGTVVAGMAAGASVAVAIGGLLGG